MDAQMSESLPRSKKRKAQTMISLLELLWPTSFCPNLDDIYELHRNKDDLLALDTYEDTLHDMSFFELHAITSSAVRCESLPFQPQHEVLMRLFRQPMTTAKK